ncbi:hypothetical protein [Rhodopila globiformis]|uniref:hypothetical protein n=1 Tax=Rhodopila globiformis TaxID=1071 RepID=UPI0011AFD9F2|nr:hypothetical protein [Rhodopila globiformis]
MATDFQHGEREEPQATVFFVSASSSGFPNFGHALSFRNRGWYGPAFIMVRPGTAALKHASRRCAVACGPA